MLGRLPGTTVYRNILQYPDAFIYHGIVILRIDSPIYFANINFIKERYATVPLSLDPTIVFFLSFGFWVLGIRDRLREFELHTGVSANKGHDVGRISFLIIEMSRKSHTLTLLSMSSFVAACSQFSQYQITTRLYVTYERILNLWRVELLKPRLQNHVNFIFIWVFDVQRWHTSTLLAFMQSRKFTMRTKPAIFRSFPTPYSLMHAFSAVHSTDTALGEQMGFY